jgi:Flp pilus assembly protein TadG
MRLKASSASIASRRGNVLVLTAALLIVIFAVIAFAVDIGYMQVAKAELQRTADAAAIAAAWELVKSESSTSDDTSLQFSNARSKAIQFAAANPVLTTAAIVDGNQSNSTTGDVVIGYLSNPSNPSATLDTYEPSQANAVKVRVRKTTGSPNGAVPLFFARALGLSTQDMQATATAALVNNFGGFKAPSDGTNLQILPFALDIDTWNGLLAGGGNDNWRWDADQQKVVSGSDNVREVNLYPQGTGSPGNRGTVDIGACNNSTNDIARQIVHGISASDLSHMGGEIKFNAQGKLYLNGDTGISAGVKDELASIIGKPRIIPIFEHVCGPGNNAEYTIVEFAGVRIVDVNLTGKMSSKRLIVQPAKVKAIGGTPATGTQKSWYVYSPAWLVR